MEQKTQKNIIVIQIRWFTNNILWISDLDIFTKIFYTQFNSTIGMALDCKKKIWTSFSIYIPQF